jgi:hypothetical protein
MTLLTLISISILVYLDLCLVHDPELDSGLDNDLDPDLRNFTVLNLQL